MDSMVKNGKDYTVGIDVGQGDIAVEDRYMRSTPEYPDGSWLHTVDGKVQVATGYYATLHPDKPSPYWHGKAPFVVFDKIDVPWEKRDECQRK